MKTQEASAVAVSIEWHTDEAFAPLAKGVVLLAAVWPIVVCRAGLMLDAGPMIPMSDDQEDTRARGCPGYAPGQTAGQGLPQ